MTNIELAQVLEDAIGMLWDGGPARGSKAKFSCNAVLSISGIAAHAIKSCLLADEFYGAGFHDPLCPTPQKRQLNRALWLTLLAEMAERGDLTMDGLQ